jgi:hypothetical protein
MGQETEAMAKLKIGLGYADERLCWSLPLEDLYTALILECGYPPRKGYGERDMAFRQWHYDVRVAMRKYYRRGAPARLEVTRPNTLSKFVIWAEQKRGALSAPQSG